MLFTNLKRIASESLFNPKKPTQEQKILMDVGNSDYWVTRAMELLMETRKLSAGSTFYHENIKRAISLLILTRASFNEKDKKPTKTRKRSSRSNSGDAKAT